ncbi:hypothetical protein KY084_05305 [Stakelama sp. CBK3Z-3]|uniref:Uncharacterized protein n=1 Tax=Stakelama flava TaxID=2860338 RepID=A0ABS6XJC2_9SPHN|nr:hypothetical protein [Stakelama flava]MBW4330288.1 hypothetical protein [Stakelama flava]
MARAITGGIQTVNARMRRLIRIQRWVIGIVAIELLVIEIARIAPLFR